MQDPAHRLSYYRKVAIDRGVPPQFIEDAVAAIAEAVERRGEGEASHWKRTAMLAAIDQVRFWRGNTRRGRAARPDSVPLEEAAGTAASDPEPVDALDEQDKRRAVMEVLRILPIREHAVLTLRLAGWRHHEIAELFGLSESRAAQIEKHGIRRLRKALR